MNELSIYQSKDREFELSSFRINDLTEKMKKLLKENDKLKSENKAMECELLSSNENIQNFENKSSENNKLKMKNNVLQKEVNELKEYITKLEKERYKGKFLKLLYERQKPLSKDDWKKEYENEPLHKLIDRLKNILIKVYYNNLQNSPSSLKILTNIENIIKEMEIEIKEGNKREQNLFKALTEYIK